MERFDGYLVFPEALERLQSAGIVERIVTAKSKGEIGALEGHIGEDDVRQRVTILQQRGFYRSVPDDEREAFFRSASAIFKERREHHWKIKRNDREEREEVMLADMLLLFGDSAAQILRPEEFGHYKERGFDSFSAWIGAVGALVEKEGKTELREKKYEWKSKLPGERTIHNTIGGSLHGDLRIEQTEVTSYRTHDPLGNEVLYRPITRKDKKRLAAYHSTEATVLVAALDFIDQRKLDSEIVKDKAKTIIREIQGGERTLGNWAQAFDRATGEMGIEFACYGFPFAEIDQTGKITNPGGYSLAIENMEARYTACVTSQGNLGFYIKGRKDVERPHMEIEFQASEIDHLIRGLVYQARNGLGRTNPDTIANILRHRFSEGFQKRT